MSELFNAHEISFSVRFQHTPQLFCTLLESAERFSLRNQEEQQQKYFEYVVPVHEIFVFLIGTLPALPASQKDVTSSKTGDLAEDILLPSSTPNPPTLSSLAQMRSSESGRCLILHEV